MGFIHWFISELMVCTSGKNISAAGFAPPEWSSSTYTKLVDITVNEAVHTVTGCPKPTPIEKMYPLAGIVPPRIRTEVAASAEENQTNDLQHPLNGYVPQIR